MSVAIRRATAEDKPAIVPLAIELTETGSNLAPNYAETIQEYWEKVNMRHALIFVAALAGEIVGYIKGRIIENGPPYVTQKNAVVEELVVATPSRGQGIGGALLGAFEEAVSDEASNIIINTIAESPAVEFYANLGFRVTMHRMEKTLSL
jgi:GNAT superfamily N-acetyltransferase